MFKNYFKIAWRNLFKNKLYSTINVFGLAVGIAGFILLLLYFNYELSYDKWDSSLNRVYKLGMQGADGIEWDGATPAPLGQFLKDNYANVESATSLQSDGTYQALISANEKKIYQAGLISVDSLFFKVFPYQLAEGNIQTALNAPNAAVISQSMSKKLFGGESPLGRTLRLYNSYDVQITGVLKDIEKPNTLNPQILFRDQYAKENFHWQNLSYETYIKLHTPKSINSLEDDINQIYYNDRIKKDSSSYEEWKKQEVKTTLFAERFSDLHNFPKSGSSNFNTVTILLFLATLLLLAGAINFSNLSVAASLRRAKEVGVRKVLGSNRQRIFWQFISETAILVFISLLIAVALLLFLVPGFEKEFNIQLQLFDPENVSIYLQVLASIIVVILLSGIYPAIFLARFNTSKVLKGDYSRGQQGKGIRNVLLVLQFGLSAFFIFAIVVVRNQMHFMQTKDKGFSSEQVVRVTVTQETGDRNFDFVQNRLSTIPGIQYVSKTTAVPGDEYADTTANMYKFDGKDLKLVTVKVSKDYFKTIGATILSGRDFNNSFADQNTRSVILNESAAALMQVDNPVGKFLNFPYCDTVQAQVVGVVKDFNIQSISHAIRPVAYSINNKACGYIWGGAMLIKLDGNNIPGTIADIEKAWKEIEPDYPLQYSFLDDNFQKLYAGYLRVQKIITFFTIIAVVIAGMGLFALTAFLLGERTREIGIRKVLGASVADISFLIAKNFLALLGIASFIALPIGWWASRYWLQTFAYQVDIGWFVFVFAVAVVFFVALFTIGLQTIRAARANPVESLRTE